MSLLHEEIARLEGEIARDKTARRESREMDAFGREGHRDPHRDDSFRDTTFLYIPSFAGDAGNRPIPSGTVFWNSPAVELFDGNTQIATNELKTGSPYTVRVIVTNAGELSATACTVDLFICDPSLSLIMANARFIGVQSVEVGPHDATLVSFSFTATAADLGHRCLFARAYSAVTKDMPISADAFDTVQDRHIGQQNLSIVKQGEAFMMDVLPKLQGVNIRIRPHPAAAAGLSRYRFARALSFREAATDARFELFENTKETVYNERLAELIGRKQRQAATATAASRGRMDRQGRLQIPERVQLGTLSTSLRSLRSSGSNGWRLEAQPDGGTKPRRTVIDVPHLNLRPAEAAVYLIEMHNDENRVVGGITLVVQG